MPLVDRRHLPNTLTILRLVLAGCFIAAINAFRYPDHHRFWANVAIAIFVAAALTDALDGYLARRWQAVSVFGRVMDPFCDKVLVLGAFIYLAGPRFVVPAWVEEGRWLTMASAVYPWMVVLVLARELLVTGIRGVVESHGISFAARRSGKWKMILQSVGIPVVLGLTVNWPVETHPWVLITNTVIVYAVIIVTAWSGIPYMVRVPQVLAGVPRGADGNTGTGTERRTETEGGPVQPPQAAGPGGVQSAENGPAGRQEPAP
jgi:CDP-diacylglycerol--glycerol-3-phosphate 3-phosphatidyltransferase